MGFSLFTSISQATYTSQKLSKAWKRFESKTITYLTQFCLSPPALGHQACESFRCPAHCKEEGNTVWFSDSCPVDSVTGSPAFVFSPSECGRLHGDPRCFQGDPPTKCMNTAIYT